MKRELLQIVFGAFMMAIFVEVGWLSPDNTFWGNVFSAIVIYFVSRFLALILGGRS